MVERSFAVFKLLRRSRKRSGFTLVEVMVALAMTGIVMTVMFTMFKTSQRSYSTQDQVAETQQNLRVAMSYVSRDVRMAGCGMNLMPDLVPDIQAFYDDPDPGGFAAWRLLVPLTATNSTTGPDAIEIMYGDVNSGEYNASITTPMTDASSTIQIDDNNNFNNGDIVVITDGVTACLFEITSITPLTSPEARLDHDSSLSVFNSTSVFKTFPENSSGYDIGSRVYNYGKMVWVTYSIDNTDPNHPNLVANRHDGNGDQVVADNIEDIQFHYFLQDGTETESPSIADSKDIVAVRISMVARSAKQDREARNFSPITLEDHAPAGGNDGYRRSILETVIQIRNMG